MLVIEYSPDSLAAASRTWLVPLLTIVTVAPETTAPF
jgi:hypothetical protein